MGRRIAIGLALLGTLIGLVACGGGGETGTGSGNGTVASNGSGLPDAISSGLKVGMDISFPPMEYYENGNEISGIDSEVAAALAEQLGVPLEIQNIGFESLITSLEGGRIDVIMSGMKDTPERHERMNMIDYFETNLGILVPKGNPAGITSLASMCGHKAAQISGSTTLTLVEEASAECPEGSIEVLRFQSNTDVNLAVLSGRADGNLEDAVSLEYVAKTAGDGNDYDAIPQPELGNEYFGIATLKSDPEVTEAVATAYKAILADGTLAAIYKKNGFEEQVPKSFMQNEGTE